MFDHYGVGFSLLLRRRLSRFPWFAGDAAAAVAVAGGWCGLIWCGGPWSLLTHSVLHGSYIPVALTPVPCHHGDLVTRG